MWWGVTGDALHFINHDKMRCCGQSPSSSPFFPHAITRKSWKLPAPIFIRLHCPQSPTCWGNEFCWSLNLGHYISRQEYRLCMKPHLNCFQMLLSLKSYCPCRICIQQYRLYSQTESVLNLVTWQWAVPWVGWQWAEVSWGPVGCARESRPFRSSSWIECR